MTPNKKILEKTLLQLEKDFPGEILPPEKGSLVGRENEYARIALKDYTREHLRFMIQQGFGRKFLLPMALEILRADPFVPRYEDDAESDAALLSAVLGIEKAYWRENPQFYAQAEEILQKAETDETEAARTLLNVSLPQKIYDFRRNSPEK